MKTKINPIRTITNFLTRLNDIRFVGQLLFVLIVLMISWSGVKSIQTNYQLQKQIADLNEQNNVQQLQNGNLKLQNQYYNSKQYLELSARENFGLAAPGEKELLVPTQVAWEHTVNLPSSVVTAANQKPNSESNFESWVDFFLHRNN